MQSSVIRADLTRSFRSCGARQGRFTWASERAAMIVRRLLALTVLSTFALSVPLSRVRAADDDSRYVKIAEAYFNESFSANPPNATGTGIHTYDSQLGSYGAADFAAQIARDKRYLDKLNLLSSAML